MTVVINQRSIGNKQPCYIVFEAGPTHGGFGGAMELVKLASEKGADAIKFQILNPDKLVSDKKQLFDFDILLDKKTNKTKTVSAPLYELLKQRTLSKDEWVQVVSFSKSLNLAFFATVGFEEEVDFLVDLGCDSLKIASADVNHYQLIDYAARTGLCVQLDTGNATLGEIETAVNIIERNNNDQIIIHQCPSGYPAHIDSIQLNMIMTLKTMFPYPIAYSDHTPGWEMDIAAVALGADLIEKTITLNRETPSVEHIMSIEPQEMALFVKSIKNTERAMGAGRRILTEDQIANRKKVRRSLYLLEPANKGTLINHLKYEFRRPGFGLGPDSLSDTEGYILNQDMKAGEYIHWHHLVRK